MANENPRQTKRLEFHAILKSAPGVREVYFQRPPSNKMIYPCILYSSKPGIKYANNKIYLKGTWYTVTLVQQDPDCATFDWLLNLQYSSLDRSYIADGLQHDVFKIFYI